MGSCFLSFLETQSKLLTSVSEIMTPLGAYKELGKGLSDSLSNSVVKEATVGWLAAAQVREEGKEREMEGEREREGERGSLRLGGGKGEKERGVMGGERKCNSKFKFPVCVCVFIRNP